MENLEEIHYLAGTQTIADRETICHNAMKAFSLTELESIKLTHFLMFFVVVVLGRYGIGYQVLLFKKVGCDIIFRDEICPTLL